jgi:hypothetical protein
MSNLQKAHEQAEISGEQLHEGVKMAVRVLYVGTALRGLSDQLSEHPSTTLPIAHFLAKVEEAMRDLKEAIERCSPTLRSP